MHFYKNPKVQKPQNLGESEQQVTHTHTHRGGLMKRQEQKNLNNQTGDKQETQYCIKGNIRQSKANWWLLLIYRNGELFRFKDFESWIRTTRTTRRSTPRILLWPRFKSWHDKLFMRSRLFVLSPLNTHLNICKRHQDEAESEYVF